MKERENEAVINIADLSFAYPSREYVFKKLNFNFFKGERIGLVGANGSGKTTLFHLIMGLLHPAEGKIEILGKERKVENDFVEVRERIGLVFQDPDDQLFSPTVAEDIAFGPLNLRKNHQDTKKILKETLEILGLSGFEDRITYNLSYGEKRLVSLATVWAMQPGILLLDEPTIWLDEGTIEKIVQILNSHPHLSYIIISHDKKFLKETTDCIYLMDNGKINKT
ncbi:MAG: energy-coupling factor ABC transporter ATP-binding protein [Candidatus Atribacteria bacterium]|nr:energy-coupling factor ABC transporter ATP-binding protein [Candidatus Atribacteria bacterium]